MERDPVMIIYHVKSGQEEKLEGLIKKAWGLYQKEGLVHAKPHSCVLIPESDTSYAFVQSFAWVSSLATEYRSKAFDQIWDQMQSLCEERNGKMAIECRASKIVVE